MGEREDGREGGSEGHRERAGERERDANAKICRETYIYTVSDRKRIEIEVARHRRIDIAGGKHRSHNQNKLSSPQLPWNHFIIPAQQHL